MSNHLNSRIDPSQPTVYQIRIRGQLGCEWMDWLDGMAITPVDNGDTFLTGTVVDQAALYGLLKKVRDLGMPLLSVNQVPLEETRESDSVHPIRITRRSSAHGNRKTDAQG